MNADTLFKLALLGILLWGILIPFTALFPVKNIFRPGSEKKADK